MPEVQITARYYPTLSTVITAEELPDLLGFLKEGLAGLLDSIYYKDLQYSKSVYGDRAFYSLRIVSRDRLDLEIPGTGIFLALNPNASDTTISSFPITVEYEWPILAYLRSFDLAGFSFLPEDFYTLALQVLKISDAQIVANAMNTFTVPANDTTSLTQQFITDMGLSIQEPEGFNPMPELLQSIQQDLGKSPALAVFENYITSGSTTAETKAKLDVFFRSLLPTDDLEAYIRNLILPKFSATLSLSAGIDFPRKMLQPVDPATLEVIPATNEETGEPRAGFRFGEALFYVSTEEGVGYTLDIALTSTAPAMIGNTGLIIEIERLKVDLSETSNIIEADNDGRPVSFQGVYAQYVAVTLPKKWFDNDDNHPGTTARLAGYDLLIGTGGISGTIALEALQAAPGDITDFYSDCFSFQYPIAITSGGSTETIQDYGSLLIYLNSLEGASYTFDLPVSVVTQNGVMETFTTQTAFSQFLNSCETEGAPPRLIKKIGGNGFEIWFTAFDITFKQGEVINTNILGGLKIPKLKDANGDIATIDITGSFDANGDFLITGSEQDGFAPIEIPNILKIYIQDVDLGSEDGNFFIGTTAEVEFTNPIMSKLLCAENGDPVRIALPNIRIYSNGNFEIVGGDIPLPTNFGLCLGPVNMSISNLNFTSTQREVNGVLREYKCWGFDGALNVDPLGVDVRGNGIKYCYTVDDDPDNGKPRDTFIRISTIEVDLIIPGDASPDSATAIINGYVSIPEPGVSTEYAGGVSLKLPKVGMSGNVDMRVDPKYPAFILDANIELPVAIPLANTGLGVFGFRGLLGFRYVAEKEAVGLTSGEDTWYDYLTYPERGINLPKFRGPAETANAKNAFSIGAGASIATLNNDTVINFRVFLLLSIPSLVLIEGKASILSENLGLDGAGEPPFYAFLAFGDSSIEAGLGADFRLPSDTGDILTLQAKVQAGFFFKNPSAWYVNIGTKQEPITARVVSLITAQLYLQLSAKGIEAGARAEFDFDKTFGPVRVRAYAYIEMGGYISFERPQLGGYFGVGGMAEIDIKILSLYIEIGLLLGAEASRPYLIYGEFRLCVKVKIFFIKIKFCGQVELKWEKSRVVDRTPIAPLPSAGQYQPSDLVKGAHMLTGDAFDIKQLKSDIITEVWEPSPNNPVYNNTVIPLDTYIDFRFSKVLDPTPVSGKTGSINNAPASYIELIPPQKTIRGREVRQVAHRYSIENIEIKAWNGSAWIDYHPYEAIEVDDPSVSPSALKIGHWQKQGKEYNALRLLSDSPFSFTQLGEPGWFIPEQSGLSPTSLFCQNELLSPEKANWLRKSLGATYLANTDEGLTNLENFFTTGRLAFWVKAPIFVDNLDTTYNATVADQNNGFGFARSLEIFNFMSVELRVPNPSSEITLTLSTTAAGVTLSFYRSVINDGVLKPEYELVDTVYRTQTELQTPVSYTNGTQAISRITVQPDFLNLEAINALNDQIELIRNEGYEAFLAGNAGETELVGASEAEELQKQIIDLLETGCAASIPGGVLTGGIGQMQVGTTFCVGMTATVLENLSEYTECTTLLHEVSWLSQRDFQYNGTIPSQTAIEADFQLAEDSISKVIAPIWRPDTKYYIKLILKDTVDNDDGGNSANYYYYYGFKTVGPIGHFHNANGVTYGLNELTGETNRDGDGKLITPDRFPLTNLGRYIDYQRSYPNADGNLLASKPLFYANEEAKLQLFFVRPQTYHMFNTWQAYQGLPEIVSEMKVIIKDPVNDSLIPYPLPVDFEDTTIPDGSEAWEEDVPSVVQTDPLETIGGPLIPGPLRLWNRLSRSSLACVSTGGDPIKPRTRKRTVTLTNLKPQKLYTALVNNVHEGVVTEVHNYVFKTSRYANFGEQINSFQLADGAGNTQQAIFSIPLALSTAEIDATWEVIGNPDATGNALEARFGSRFDQVIEGIWGLAPLPVAETMEFNAVVDQNTGDTIALWVRNPEPLNDPKIPVNAIAASLEVLNNANNSTDGNYKVLHSKDYAQVLIMRNNKRITNTALRIRFDYLLWDGNRYAVEDSVLVEGLNVNS